MKDLIDQYERGAAELRAAVSGMTLEQLQARPIPNKWTTHELVCHLTDAEMLYADRIKRVAVETNPPLAAMDPDVHLKLAIAQRNVADELALIELVRKQITAILRTLQPEDFKRTGLHSEAGPLTLETLLQRVTGHIPHHVKFIAEKRAALKA